MERTEEKAITPREPAEPMAAEIITDDHSRHLVPVLVIAAEVPEKEWAGKARRKHVASRIPG